MNCLQQLIAQAGQEKSERYYGAEMQIFQADDPGAQNPMDSDQRVPCCHTHQKIDYLQIGAGIQAVSTIESITFRADRCSGNIPAKGTPFILYLASGARPLALQLWDGGLLPDGLIYQFVAVDANFKA